MFNTFGPDGSEFPFGKTHKIHMKQRPSELNNLSTIQLNPWHYENLKSPSYFESQHFSNFHKPSHKTQSAVKHANPRQNVKRDEINLTFERKKFDIKNLTKKQSFFTRHRIKFPSEHNDLQRMNKTISVHNFQGDKMLGLSESIDKKEKYFEKQQKRHRTTISNPMYGKFCNSNVSEKQNIMKRKKIMSEMGSSNYDNWSEKDINNFRTKMSTLSMSKGGSKNIHEVRKRLKSTSEIRRQIQEGSQTQMNQTSLTVQNQNMNQKYGQSLMSTQPLPFELPSYSPKQTPDQSALNDSKQKFKLGRRKNLYIGFRKFFNPSINLKNIQKKELHQGEIVNLEALMQHGEVDMLKRFQSLEQTTYESLLNKQ